MGYLGLVPSERSTGSAGTGGVGWSTPDPDLDRTDDFLDARKARLGDILEDIGTKKLVYIYRLR